MILFEMNGRLCEGGELLDKLLSKYISLIMIFLYQLLGTFLIWVTCELHDITEVESILKRMQRVSLYKF